MTAHNFIDLTGQLFGRLTVLERGPNGYRGKAKWWCLCACGTKKLVLGVNLREKQIQSCGCLSQDMRGQCHRTHGMTHTTEYRIWSSMLTRCLNPQAKVYASYGGRGITVCERWRNSFEHFLLDVGMRPGPGYSLDRYPDNDGPYAPGNIRWATKVEQTRNTRRNHLITLAGTTRCLAEWLEVLGMLRSTYSRRRERGMSDEEALTTPVQRYRKESHKDIYQS
jgi:hypothetical protein